MGYEQEERVEAFLARLYCECGEEMKRQPIVNMSSPPQYQYVCPKCGRRERDTEAYPAIRFKDESGKTIA